MLVNIDLAPVPTVLTAVRQITAMSVSMDPNRYEVSEPELLRGPTLF